MILEMHMRLYHSEHATDYIEVCPDADGLGMVEIRQVSDDGKIGDRIMVNLDNVETFIKAVRMTADFMRFPTNE